VFHTDVSKVDRDVAMVVHVCYKSLSSMFHLSFKRMLQACLFGCCICLSHICCKCFIWMLCMFAMVFKCFYKCFRWGFKCFICLFYMLHVLHPNVSKLDRVLHMGYAWEPEGV
jgi:hypothetical protein